MVARVARRGQVPLELQEIDISTDPDLERRYRTEIPVLMIDGRKVAKYKLTEAELVRKLESGAGGGPVRPPLIPTWRQCHHLAVTMRWPRRFRCQQPSSLSKQTCSSSPLLMIRTRSMEIPRLVK